MCESRKDPTRGVGKAKARNIANGPVLIEWGKREEWGVSEWWMVDGGWWMVKGEWRMVNGEWRMVSGELIEWVSWERATNKRDWETERLRETVDYYELADWLTELTELTELTTTEQPSVYRLWMLGCLDAWIWICLNMLVRSRK